jgi:hypothetical protein
MPRQIAARASNLVHWTIQPEGGHFAPSEVPDLLVADVRTFFRGLRRSELFTGSDTSG